MSVIRIEADEHVKHERCPSCGGENWLVHGFVYADEEPHGLYFVEWCEGQHDLRNAYMTISFGNYGDEEATGADRYAFCVETRCDGLALTDVPVRDRPDFLGRFVPRGEALAMDDIDHLWHVTDHIWTDDRRIAAVAAWLCGDLSTALDADDDAPALG